MSFPLLNVYVYQYFTASRNLTKQLLALGGNVRTHKTKRSVKKIVSHQDT